MKNVPYIAASAKLRFTSPWRVRWGQSSCPNNKIGSFRIHIIVGMPKTMILNDTALLLRGQARPDQCFGTPASATTLMLRGQARFDRCFGTPASTTTLLLHGQTRSV